MSEHYSQSELTHGEINAMNKLMNCSPQEEAESLIKSFTDLHLSEIVAIACSLKVCNSVLDNTIHNYFRQEHWKTVRTILLYKPIGNTTKIF